MWGILSVAVAVAWAENCSESCCCCSSTVADKSGGWWVRARTWHVELATKTNVCFTMPTIYTLIHSHAKYSLTTVNWLEACHVMIDEASSPSPFATDAFQTEASCVAAAAAAAVGWFDDCVAPFVAVGACCCLTLTAAARWCCPNWKDASRIWKGEMLNRDYDKEVYEDDKAILPWTRKLHSPLHVHCELRRINVELVLGNIETNVW